MAFAFPRITLLLSKFIISVSPSNTLFTKTATISSLDSDGTSEPIWKFASISDDFFSKKLTLGMISFKLFKILDFSFQFI